MAWVVLLVAGLLEVGWAIGLKYSEGFTKPLASIGTLAGMILSFFLLSRALEIIPVGTAYAVWTGIGAVGTVVFGMIFLGEPREVSRIVCLFLIIAGIVGLKAVSPH